MESKRDELIEQARAKRRRKSKVRRKEQAADTGIVEQVKEVVVEAAEKVESLVKSAAAVVKGTIPEVPKNDPKRKANGKGK